MVMSYVHPTSRVPVEPGTSEPSVAHLVVLETQLLQSPMPQCRSKKQIDWRIHLTTRCLHVLHVEVYCWNRGTPKSSMLVGFSINYKPSILGYTISGNPHVFTHTQTQSKSTRGHGQFWHLNDFVPPSDLELREAETDCKGLNMYIVCLKKL